LNGISLSALLGLPAAILISAICWAVLWFAADFVIDWLRIRIFEINQLSVLVLLGLYIGTGAALGMPLGKMLRRSGVIRMAPSLLSCVVVLCAVIAGEIGYVALRIFWNVGILNLAAAVQLLGPVMASYSGFWIANKLFCACATGAFCVSAAGERKTASLKI
jgi:hypothetical protein